MKTLLARGQITIAAIKDGKEGADAVSVLVENAPLVFDTNDDGIIPVGISKAAKVKVMKGNRNVSDECSDVNSRDDMCVNCKCGATQENGYISVSISGNNITKNDVIVDGVSQGKVSATSGYAVAQVAYDGVTYFAQVPFSVNVAKFTGVVAFNNKSYKIQFDELSKNAATKDELKDATSKFEQTAREISLSVSEKTIGRRNLLRGSAFQRDDNNRVISNDARIEMNSGYQGTNCIKVIDDTDGTPHYIGVYWDGSQGGKSIKIEKGKKYTISCWYFTNDTNASLYLEAIYTDKQTNATRKGQATYLSPNSFSPKYKQWQLFTTVIDTTNAKSDYIAFNFWELCNVNAGRIEAYICRPMVEEGDTYNGWTLSDKDYDYVGANLIDNSRTFELGGNVIRVVGTKKLVGDAYELSATLGNDYNTFYEIDNTAFKLNTDYTISFEVKGDAKYMGVYVYYEPTNTPWAYCREQQDAPLYEANGDGKTDGYGLLLEVKDISDKTQKVWSHFKFKERLPESIYFQFPKNAEQTDVTSWNVTITKPKIEEGAVVTEYTERKSDLVDKASLKAAGINIDVDYVEIYGDKVKVSQTEGGTPIALFADGKINAQLINATNIVTEGLQAQTIDAKNATLENLNVKNVHVTGSLRNPFVDYDNHMDNNYTDNVIIYDMYNKNLETDYELLWDSSQNGRLIRIANIYSLLDRAPAATAIFTAPKEQCFFENGLMKDTLYIGPSQIVELLGIGDINYGGKHIIGGWIVMNRINLLNDNQFRTSNVYGNKLGIILMGTSEDIFAFDSVDTNIMYNRTSDKRFKFEKTGNGVWKLKYPSEWVDNKYMYANDELAIQVTCTAPGCYATSRLGFESLNITTYKGTSPTYDTSFYFEVKNMLEMLPIV